MGTCAPTGSRNSRQLDVETSFLDQDQIMERREGLIRESFVKTAEVALHKPFPRITFADAMRRYGSS